MKALPYENATSGQRALDEIERILGDMGCSKVGFMRDNETGERVVQFQMRGRNVHMKLDPKGYAAAWLRVHPWTSRKRTSEADWKAHAMQVASVAICSVFRDYLKTQAVMIEIEAMSFDAAFLSHIMLPEGVTVIEKLGGEDSPLALPEAS